MSDLATSRRAIGIINEGLRERYALNEPIEFDVNGKPDLRIMSFEPLAFEKYGLFKKPRVAGRYALRAFLAGEHPVSGLVVYAGVEAGQSGYGFILPEWTGIDTLNSVASRLGLGSSMRARR